jgi:hypothetical protein
MTSQADPVDWHQRRAAWTFRLSIVTAIALSLAGWDPAIAAAQSASETCDLAKSYPGENRVDIAMTLVDRGRYPDYAAARAVVDHDLTYVCPGIR